MPDWSSCSVQGVATLSCIPLIFSLLINAALSFAAVTALFFVLYGGYKFITSGGDPKQVETAKKTWQWAIVGLIIIFFAYFIINIIATVTNVPCILKFGFDNCK